MAEPGRRSRWDFFTRTERALMSVRDDNTEQCEKLKWRLFVYFLRILLWLVFLKKGSR